MNGLLKYIKQAGTEAVANGAPCAVMFGQVTSVEPSLKIKVEQRLLLGEKQLIRTESTQKMQEGDNVILLRMQGGQKFIVLDKVYHRNGGDA